MPYKENAKYTKEDPRDTSERMKEKARGTGDRGQEEKNAKQPQIKEQPGSDPAAN